MNISRVSGPQEVYLQPVQRAVKIPQKAGEVAAATSDSLALSESARDFQAAKAAIAAAPDVRQDIVNGIMKKINAGTYGVSAADVAEKMAATMLV